MNHYPTMFRAQAPAAAINKLEVIKKIDSTKRSSRTKMCKWLPKRRTREKLNESSM